MECYALPPQIEMSRRLTRSSGKGNQIRCHPICHRMNMHAARLRSLAQSSNLHAVQTVFKQNNDLDRAREDGRHSVMTVMTGRTIVVATTYDGFVIMVS